MLIKGTRKTRFFSFFIVKNKFYFPIKSTTVFWELPTTSSPKGHLWTFFTTSYVCVHVVFIAISPNGVLTNKQTFSTGTVIHQNKMEFRQKFKNTSSRSLSDIYIYNILYVMKKYTIFVKISLLLTNLNNVTKEKHSTTFFLSQKRKKKSK